MRIRCVASAAGSTALAALDAAADGIKLLKRRVQLLVVFIQTVHRAALPLLLAAGGGSARRCFWPSAPEALFMSDQTFSYTSLTVMKS